MNRPTVPAGAPSVHAVVVHHRGQEILSRCLETLLSSAGVDLRVAVVANACPEPLPEVAESHPRVLVLRSETPLGFGAANNRGASRLRERAGRPEYLYFINDDTASEPGALATLVEHMKRTPACAVAGPRLMILGSGGIVNSLGLDVAVTGEAWDEGLGRPLDECGPLAGVRPALAVTGTALLVREDVFDRLGGWREIFHYYYEDVDLCLRARSLGGEVEVVTGAVVHHAVSATARRDSDFKRYHILRNRLLLMALHWPIGLLLRTAPRVLALELGRFLVRLGRGRWGLARVQARAWAGFLRRLPSAARLRGRKGPGPSWTSLLEPPGAVPAIRLPDAGASA
jgi:N-acetylglucosaminyl-diphospho-decaprenol L-rhamnosyltransferase